MGIYQQNRDGSWEPAKPIPPSRTLRFELWLRRRGWHALARAIARWDERKLGR
jgi:hypothetical protein